MNHDYNIHIIFTSPQKLQKWKGDAHFSGYIYPLAMFHSEPTLHRTSNITVGPTFPI